MVVADTVTVVHQSQWLTNRKGDRQTGSDKLAGAVEMIVVIQCSNSCTVSEVAKL